ncbi:MAG: DsbA family protein [Dehalococcoidia bacterium]
MARSRGLTMRLPPVQPRSRRALETAEFARDRGAFDAVHVALFRAFFEHGRDLDDLDVLAEVATAAGLDAGDLHQALARGDYTAKVVTDERIAHEIGVNAVPAMLIERLDPATGEIDEDDETWEALMGAAAVPLSSVPPLNGCAAACARRTSPTRRPDRR